ncbi:hypothetical protein B0H17DRAFT_546296 [Mycena rosella]|uniref:Uncharacterized protein n=1 Tax=Mycena rosella TaxID=1033263 RepID=A0AAD7GJI6_MYCRO|nr:hypothetical protein B0H17DRAFT_546296 [Mycena rosella]
MFNTEEVAYVSQGIRDPPRLLHQCDAQEGRAPARRRSHLSTNLVTSTQTSVAADGERLYPARKESQGECSPKWISASHSKPVQKAVCRKPRPLNIPIFTYI